jgi:hypothetical protein
MIEDGYLNGSGTFVVLNVSGCIPEIEMSLYSLFIQASFRWFSLNIFRV